MSKVCWSMLTIPVVLATSLFLAGQTNTAPQTEFPPFGLCPNQSKPFVLEGGPNQTAELGQIRVPKSR
jgi:hypothetical protein